MEQTNQSYTIYPQIGLILILALIAVIVYIMVTAPLLYGWEPTNFYKGEPCLNEQQYHNPKWTTDFDTLEISFPNMSLPRCLELSAADLGITENNSDVTSNTQSSLAMTAWKNYTIKEIGLSIEAPADTEMTIPSRYDAPMENEFWRITNDHNYQLDIYTLNLTDVNDLDWTLFAYALSHKDQVLKTTGSDSYIQLIEDVKGVKTDHNITGYTFLVSNIDDYSKKSINVQRIFHFFHDGILYQFIIKGPTDTFDSETHPAFFHTMDSIKFPYSTKEYSPPMIFE